MGLIELIVAAVFFLGIAGAMALMLAYIVRQNKKLARHTCTHCSAPVSPRAINCATCGEPCPAQATPRSA